MHTYLAVINSNRLNRYDMLFSIPSLESGVDQSWDVGIPMHVSHDRHRVAGWSRALGIHLEPGLARLTAVSFVPETDAEASNLCALTGRYWAKRVTQTVIPHRAELESRLSPCLCGTQELVEADCAAAVETGLPVRRFPDVFGQRDRDGLVPISGLVMKGPGVFEQDGLLLFAHRFFRRSLSRRNTLNAAFLSQFADLRTKKDLDVRIALDEDMVGLASTYRQTVELEYWWGPKFSDDLGEIKLRVVTCHAATGVQRRLHGISRTEFWWYQQDGARTFECEELRDLPSFGIGEDAFGCRFIHSRLDASTNLPIHLDGAIRLYGDAAMVERLEKDLYRAGRHSQYTKLWRVDGRLDVPTWKELISHFYRDNPLVGEYFGGRDPRSEEQPELLTKEAAPDCVSTYVPCHMKRGDGVRLHVAYHAKVEEPRTPREIRSHDWVSHGSDRYNYVESDVTEIVKALRRRGHSVTMPSGIVRVKFRDSAFNLPLIIHSGEAAAGLAGETLVAVAELCKAWAEDGENRCLSFTLAIEYEDRDVHYSFAGHVADLDLLLGRARLLFPRTVQEIGSWLEKVYASLGEGGKEAMDQPPLHEMLQETGIMMFKRRFLESDEYTLVQDPVTSEWAGRVSIPKERNDLCGLVKSGQLGIGMSMLIRCAECSRCKGAYETCACSKFLDSNVTQVIKEWTPLAPFWTAS